MLENAVRICDANFGNIYPLGRRGSAPCCDPQYAACLRRSIVRRFAVTVPIRTVRFGRMVATKAVVHVADVSSDASYAERAIRQSSRP